MPHIAFLHVNILLHFKQIRWLCILCRLSVKLSLLLRSERGLLFSEWKTNVAFYLQNLYMPMNKDFFSSSKVHAWILILDDANNAEVDQYKHWKNSGYCVLNKQFHVGGFVWVCVEVVLILIFIHQALIAISLLITFKNQKHLPVLTINFCDIYQMHFQCLKRQYDEVRREVNYIVF